MTRHGKSLFYTMLPANANYTQVEGSNEQVDCDRAFGITVDC